VGSGVITAEVFPVAWRAVNFVQGEYLVLWAYSTVLYRTGQSQLAIPYGQNPKHLSSTVSDPGQRARFFSICN